MYFSTSHSFGDFVFAIHEKDNMQKMKYCKVIGINAVVNSNDTVSVTYSLQEMLGKDSSGDGMKFNTSEDMISSEVYRLENIFSENAKKIRDEINASKKAEKGNDTIPLP